MKRFILLLYLICCILSLIAQSTYNPEVSSQSNSTHNVWAVRCYKDKTLIFFECAASRFKDASFSISEKTTLTYNNNTIKEKIKSWGMYDAENDITTERNFNTFYTVDSGTRTIYVMEFASIPLDIEKISVRENTTYGFFWEDIKIKNSAKIEDIKGENTPKKEREKVSKNESEDSNNWSGTGSGFFISSTGYIATNYHVVQETTRLQVEYYQNGEKYIYPAKIIASDNINDLAIIQIEHKEFTSIPEIPYKLETRTEDVGSEVFTLGYPLTFIMGEEIKYTKGEISSKSGFKGDIREYQISVPTTYGNSGGPLFDTNGNVIGITSSGLNKELADNANYAIKSIYLQTLVDACQEKIDLPKGINLSGKSKPEIIKSIQGFVVLIKVKQ